MNAKCGVPASRRRRSIRWRRDDKKVQRVPSSFFSCLASVKFKLPRDLYFAICMLYTRSLTKSKQISARRKFDSVLSKNFLEYKKMRNVRNTFIMRYNTHVEFCNERIIKRAIVFSIILQAAKPAIQYTRMTSPSFTSTTGGTQSKRFTNL